MRSVVLAMLLLLAAVPLSLAIARDVGAPVAWIISPEEAALPLARELVTDKSDPDGPKVIVRDPNDIQEVSPPVTIDVAFETRDGTTLDIASLKVTYLKLFGIDITNRLRPYLTDNGIYAPNAPLAAGNHNIEISVRDTMGRRTVQRFHFTVLKN